MQLVLSLFPGIGLLDRAFEEEGFCVVRGPDLLWGGDVRRFNPPAGRFDGVIGGPPCHKFSDLERLAEWRGKPHENLIPEFERCIAEAKPQWFVMENVPAAPEPTVEDYTVRSFVMNNRETGAEQSRKRLICFGSIDGRELQTAWWLPPQSRRRSKTVCKINFDRGGQKAFEEARRLQGLPSTWDLPPFKSRDKMQALFNGVPLPMGRAIARAVREAIETTVMSA